MIGMDFELGMNVEDFESLIMTGIDFEPGMNTDGLDFGDCSSPCVISLAVDASAGPVACSVVALMGSLIAGLPFDSGSCDRLHETYSVSSDNENAIAVIRSQIGLFM